MAGVAGCKQGLLFQKCKLLSWGTPCIHTLHHPLGRKHFRKETGVCIIHRNNIKSHYPAFELMRNLTHIPSKDTEIEPVPFVEQKRSSCLLNIQKTHHHTGKIFCSIKYTTRNAQARPSCTMLRTGPGTPHLHISPWLLLLYLYKFPAKNGKSKASGTTHCNINNTSIVSLLHLAKPPLHIFYSAGTLMVAVGALMWTGERREGCITEQMTWHFLEN